MNTYETTFTVKCPNDDDSIDYTLRLRSDSTIWVEDINRATDIKTGAFHESIADGLYALLGGRQVITAVHQGVKIKTVRGEFSDIKRLSSSIRAAFFRNGVSDWKAIANEVTEDMK